MLVLNEQEVRELLPMDECVDVLDRLFQEAAEGTVSNMSRYRIPLPRGSHQVMAGMSAQSGATGLKTYVTGAGGGSRMAVLLHDLETGDLIALIGHERISVEETYTLDSVQVSCGSNAVATATVQLTDQSGQQRTDAATGTGPVDAVYQAINRIVNVPNELTEFSVNAVTEGIDAVGEVSIRIEQDGREYIGRGADTDIIVASARAYMNALNRLLAMGDTTRSEEAAGAV